MVRSEMSARSNSAKAAKMPKTSFPDAVVVSMAAPFQACRQLGAVIRLPRGLVFVKVVLVDAGGDKGIALQIGALRPVGFRHPHVSDERGVTPVIYTVE